MTKNNENVNDHLNFLIFGSQKKKCATDIVLHKENVELGR